MIESRDGKYRITFDEPFPIYSTISRNNRSMELSCLVKWRDKLLSACDTTGIIYEIESNRKEAYQRYLVPSGDGNTNLPLKVEWATVGPNEELYFGSIGKEWIHKGVCLSFIT